MHASTDDEGVTRFMVEHEDGSRTTFAAYITAVEITVEREDFESFLGGPRAFGPRQGSLDVEAMIIGEPTRTAYVPTQQELTERRREIEQ